MKTKRVIKPKLWKSETGIKHDCGNGFISNVIQTKDLSFCGTCGREFNKSELDKIKRG